VSALPSVRRISGRVRRRGVQESIARAFQRAFRMPLTLVATRVLRKRIRNISSIDAALDFAYGFSFGGIVFEPWQERSEIRGFLNLIAEIRPRTILEVGTSYGGSLFLFARVATPDALIVSIDLPDGEFGGGYPAWRSVLYRSFAAAGQRIRLLRADSHEPQTLEAARAALGGRQVDMLFIDGDHTYEGVKQDFEMYRSLLRSGGVVAFHDIVPPSPNGPTPRSDNDLQGGEVSQFWDELRSTHEVFEFVEDWHSGRFGIGAIEVA
jgi:predicted O-methyltransferase YrrM